MAAKRGGGRIKTVVYLDVLLLTNFLTAYLLLLAAGALYLALSLLPQGTVAVVEQNGQEVARRELSQLAGPETLSLTGENGVEVTITFTPQGAAVTASTCPDQVCVQTGQLTRAGESAICLPARATLRLEGGGDAIDATVY